MSSIVGASLGAIITASGIGARARLLRLLVREGRWLALGLSGGHLLSAAVPSAAAVAAGYAVRVADRGTGRSTELFIAAGAVGLVVLVSQAGRFTGVIEHMVTRQIDGGARRRVRAIAGEPAGVAHLESAAFQDDVLRATDDQRGQGRWCSPGTAATSQLALLFQVLGAVIAAALLATISLPAAVLLLAVATMVRFRIRVQWMALAREKDNAAPSRRRLAYWAGLAESEAVKEVRLFGMAPWVLRRWRSWSIRSGAAQWRTASRILRQQTVSTVLVIGSTAAGLGVLGADAFSGRIDSGQLLAGVLLMWGVFRLSELGEETYDVEYGAVAVEALARLDRYRAASVTPRQPAPVAPDQNAVPQVRFEEVDFGYLDAGAKPLFEGLTLTLHPGETVALVGRNGSGKTTLVKLLAGLYLPASGRITVDGVDLADLDLDGWRRRLAVVFQDFVRYPASIADNVALSAPEALADRAGVSAALHRAGATELLSRLTDGIDSSLWREGTAGADVSGGQWQRIALARALFASAHGRRLLVLDEPTAHLDVRAELAFHEDVISAVAGRNTVLLISHRLSTVRPADRILLLSDGRIAEEGSHQDLMGLGGEYSRLYQLQASRFTEEAVSGER